MKISLNWLNEYIEISDIPPVEVLEKLTVSGLEVDEVENHAKSLENIVVGFVKEKKKHPNADKLSVCLVSDGVKDYNVVCGAPNVDAGQKVAFAKIGAVIPQFGEKLKKTKIRGEVSEGMICAEDELNLGDDHTGIMVLDEEFPAGTPLVEALGLNDVTAEIDITPNRADALSHIGIARDLSAIYKRDVQYPSFNFEGTGRPANQMASVEILDNQGCPRYVATVVRNVNIKESPEWLKTRLLSVGLRPINNVVDVTNFILYELGQPLHSFDLDKLNGKKIIVRKAGKDETFVTLDSKERKLSPEDLMICDAEKPVAIAGIMGGENSEVSDNTKNVLIESAYFNPSRIRKTSKRLGLSTDSSYRFERGCNPEITLFAAQRAAALIAELADGEIAEGYIDVYPNPLERKKVELRFARITKILGFEIPAEEAEAILTGLGFVVLAKEEEKLLIEVPLFRHDIEREIDLIEEVARIYGYNKIKSVEKIAVTLEEKIDQGVKCDNVKNILTGLGYNEMLNSSLLNEERANQFGKAIAVLSPQTVEMSHLRTSLIPGALLTVSRNIKVREKDLKLFEIGHTYELKKEPIDSFDDFTETERMLLLITGKANSSEWYAKERDFDVYDLLGDIEELFSKVGLSRSIKNKKRFEGDEHFEFKIQKIIGKEVIGEGGKIRKEFLKKYDIEQEVFLFDFNLEKILKLQPKVKRYSELLKYPKVFRDFAFVVDKKITNEQVIKAIKKGSSNLLKNIKLFDIFESQSLGEGKKSLAYELEYYDESRTLTEEEVDKDFWNAIETVTKELDAKLRG